MGFRITTTARKRASIVHRNETTDKMRSTLSTFKMLQESQLETIRQKLAHAGVRKKELAVYVVVARLILPIVLGGTAALFIYGMNYFPEWGSFKRFMGFAAAVGLGYKGPEIYIQNLVSKRTLAIRKGLPDALDLLVICAEAGLTVDAAFGPYRSRFARFL